MRRKDGSALETHPPFATGRRNRSYSRLSEIVMANFVAAVPVETITAPSELAIIVRNADKLDQPLKTAERRRRIDVQVEHDLMVRHLDVLARDHHGGFRGESVIHHAMRNKADGLISP